MNKWRWIKKKLRKLSVALSVALMRGNAWRMRAELSVGSKVKGRVLQQSLARPTVEEKA